MSERTTDVSIGKYIIKDVGNLKKKDWQGN
jgi:hypothetical protein